MKVEVTVFGNNVPFIFDDVISWKGINSNGGIANTEREFVVIQQKNKNTFIKLCEVLLLTQTEEVEENEVSLNDLRNDKEKLKEFLGDGLFTVKFEKKDKSIRVLKGTRNIDLIPEDQRPKVQPIDPNTGKPKVRKESDQLLPVFDVEANGWRMLTIANLIELPIIHEAEPAADSLI